MGQGARGNEDVEILELRRPETARAGRRRLVEHVDRLAGPILARARHHRPGGAPELSDRLFLADDHARHAAGRVGRERAAAPARRDDVRPEVTERVEPPLALNRPKARMAATSRILEEDALDGVARAEVQHLVEGGIDQHGRESSQ